MSLLGTFIGGCIAKAVVGGVATKVAGAGAIGAAMATDTGQTVLKKGMGKVINEVFDETVGKKKKKRK